MEKKYKFVHRSPKKIYTLNKSSKPLSSLKILKQFLEKNENEKKSSIFDPFLKERDHIGRLISVI